MKEMQQIHFKDRKEFRDWLYRNHDDSSGFKMVFYKKHTGKPNISYEAAVEEAICFGWIDSTVNRIDAERYTRQFTPRTNSSNGSDVNKIRALKVFTEGRMTEAGLAKIDVYQKTGKLDWGKISNSPKPIPTTPDILLNELKKEKVSLNNFKHLPPSHKRNYIEWIMSAKRDETRLKRVREAVELLRENKRLGMK